MKQFRESLLDGVDDSPHQKGHYQHCVIALDKDTVLQVFEWGAGMEQLPLKKVEEEWGKVDRIYQSKIKG